MADPDAEGGLCPPSVGLRRLPCVAHIEGVNRRAGHVCPLLSRVPHDQNCSPASARMEVRRVRHRRSLRHLVDRTTGDLVKGSQSVTTTCPFCQLESRQVFHDDGVIAGVWDEHPVSPGHALLVPRRHVATWFDADVSEQQALTHAIAVAQRAVLERHRPDGFNIGVNVGAAAGQTILHLHVHVIPRYVGDVPDPRGGVRHVVPWRGNYLQGAPIGDSAVASGLVAGDVDPLLPHLVRHLGNAVSADMAVSFVQPSGMACIDPHLRDLLARGGRLRVLTGDYLDITDPTALLQLLDLEEEGRVELRVFETTGFGAFHPKTYVLADPAGYGVAFVGSANLSASALTHGVEWNYRVVSSSDTRGFGEIQLAFEQLFRHPRTRRLTTDWVASYRRRRVRPLAEPGAVSIPEEPLPPVVPNAVQEEALSALEASRTAGNRAGLVVLATGLGKTWLSAFDSNRPEFARVLFVAHREEILAQAMKTFRRIRPNAMLGHFTGQAKQPEADVLFASVQTLGRTAHLQRFGAEQFDYIVIDEFHHAAAGTYRRLIEYFSPKFLLGLTATPERSDGGDLLALCQENVVYRCDLDRGIRLGLLAPFRYLGVPDEVDYTNIPWRSTRFDEEALTTAVATQSRALNALEQWRRHAGPGSRTLAFCVSQRHADFMARFFDEQGLRAVAVHAGTTSAPRAASLERLEAGELDIVCAVDMFNEGVDLPALDTVMMLRPTESRIVWLQQFGRGLRVCEGKTQLTVIDYIGNHRTFLLKPQTLFNLQPGRHELAAMLERYERGTLDLPPGCEVVYDLEAIEILKKLIPPAGQQDALRRYYEDFRLTHGIRPTAVEALHDGYNPRAVRKAFGSWFGLVAAMGDLASEQEDVLRLNQEWLEALETTAMTKSYKMLLLIAMINQGRFPGEVGIGELVEGFRSMASRTAVLQADVEADLSSQWELRRLLERNPIAAWAGGKGTGERSYFSYDEQVFKWLPDVAMHLREPLQELTRELAEWRLAEYLQRLQAGVNPESFSGRVKRTSGTPVILLPDRQKQPGLPEGLTPLRIGSEELEADFARSALNVVRRSGQADNALPSLLRDWFGPDAGLPGTHHSVTLRLEDNTWTMAPARRRDADLTRWQSYLRDQLPAIFGSNADDTTWMTGFLIRSGHMILLVTLDKQQHDALFQYQDRFLSRSRFQWQSRNNTSQASSDGQAIKMHRERGMPVHLFVRATKKLAGGKTSPFVYCGEVEFEKWEGDKPITVTWRLPDPVPQRLWNDLAIPSTT